MHAKKGLPPGDLGRQHGDTEKRILCLDKEAIAMTTWERTQQFWSVLVFAASEQRVISYEMLSKITGMAQECGRELGHILRYCQENELPLLNLLAVSKNTGKPGDGYPVDISELPAQQTRVFLYDWLSHGVPSVEKLQKAHEKQKKSVAA